MMRAQQMHCQAKIAGSDDDDGDLQIRSEPLFV